MAPKFDLLGLLLLFVLRVHAWTELTTTYGSSNAQPRTVADAKKAGWIKINDCFSENRFAGIRYAPPMDIPDMMLLFDVKGNVAGMQSVLPEADMITQNCSINDYYVRDVINNSHFCVSTMYFKDPRSICSASCSRDKVDKLMLQIGEGLDNLDVVPGHYDNAANNTDDWIAQNYFLGMGHHFTHTEVDLEDCPRLRPIQTLYASTSEHGCANTGFVWSHISSTTGQTWEKPGRAVVFLIFRSAPACVVDKASNNMVTTMHVFLGGSTSNCFD